MHSRSSIPRSDRLHNRTRESPGGDGVRIFLVPHSQNARNFKIFTQPHRSAGRSAHRASIIHGNGGELQRPVPYVQPFTDVGGAFGKTNPRQRVSRRIWMIIASARSGGISWAYRVALSRRAPLCRRLRKSKLSLGKSKLSLARLAVVAQRPFVAQHRLRTRVGN